MKKFRKTVTALIGFDRRERRGTYILSLLLLTLLVVRTVAFRPVKVPDDLPPLPDAMAGAGAGIGSGKEGITSAPLFNFDPNTATYDELVTLGLSERQARTLVNYRNSGARFRKPEDLARVYGIDSVTLERLIPFIMISETSIAARNQEAGESRPLSRGGNEAGKSAALKSPVGTTRGVEEEKKPREKISAALLDLNRCTAEELVTLPGIGPVLSVRIIRYRSLLGGYVEKEQLAEVYGLDSTIVGLIGSRLTITYDSVRPLELDSATFGDLARHPYLGYDAARRITSYRSVSQLPPTLGNLVVSGVITSRQAERIAPYVRPARGSTGSDYEFISSKVLK